MKNIIILLFLLCACGENINENDFFIEKELSIRTSNNYIAVIEQAVRELNAEWDEGHLIVEFDIYDRFEFFEDYNDMLAARDARRTRLIVELMSGTASDLILNDEFLPLEFAQSGHLADFYKLIDNCPVTTRDDFFMNILQAGEFKGGLYFMPMDFGFLYVGISKHAPFIDKFQSYSYITISDLMNMYLESDSNMYSGIPSFFNAFNFNISNFIDFNTRTANINNNNILAENIILTNRFKQVTYEPMPPRFEFPVFWAQTRREQAENQMFLLLQEDLNVADAFFDRDIHFNNFIPLADDFGNLILSNDMFGVNIMIPVQGDNDLTWKLTRYIIAAFAEPVGESRVVGGWGTPAPWDGNNFNIPIIKNLVDARMKRVIDNLQGGGFRLADESYIDKIYKYANMPISPSRFLFESFLSPLDDFELGLITVEQALQHIQNSVSLWLIE